MTSLQIICLILSLAVVLASIAAAFFGREYFLSNESAVKFKKMYEQEHESLEKFKSDLTSLTGIKPQSDYTVYHFDFTVGEIILMRSMIPETIKIRSMKRDDLRAMLDLWEKCDNVIDKMDGARLTNVDELIKYVPSSQSVVYIQKLPQKPEARK